MWLPLTLILSKSYTTYKTNEAKLELQNVYFVYYTFVRWG